MTPHPALPIKQRAAAPTSARHRLPFLVAMPSAWRSVLVGMVLLSAGCTAPSPVEIIVTPGATPLPTSLPFEPRSTVPIRPMPTLQPMIPTDPEAPAGLPPFIPRPTEVPLPRLCLMPAFADVLAQMPGCTAYDIRLEIDPERSHVDGTQRIDYTNATGQPLNDLVLRLFPNAPHYGGAMTVTHTQVGGRLVTGTLKLDDTVLRLPLQPPLAAGGRITVSMDFGVTVPRTRSVGFGLFSYVSGVMALPNVYPMIPAHVGEGWSAEVAPNYADDVHAAVAAYSVRVTAPSDLTLVASGVCNAIGPGRWICDASPMRDFTLVLSSKFQRVAQLVNGVVVNSYFYPGYQQSGQFALDVAADAVRAFTEYVGPYPYSELDVVMTPSLLGGMEYPGLVVVKDAYYAGDPRLEWIVAHEVAHQWWYVVVGSDQVNVPWLDESLTSYSTMLYYEYLYGKGRAAGIVEGEFRGTYRELRSRGYDLPVGLPADEYGGSLYWDVIYRQGPLYFDALRAEVGDRAFFEILRTYYTENRFGLTTPERLLDAVEAVSGDRHLALFDEWILGGE